MILTVANIKGGAGKSTLATNLAVARSKLGKTLLVDCDHKQQNALAFTVSRMEMLGEAGYAALRLQGKQIQALNDRQRYPFADIVIDVGGADSTELRHAMMVADTVLMPFQASAFDLIQVDHMAHLVDQVKQFNPAYRAFMVLNAVEPFGNWAKDGEAMLAESGLPVAPTLHRRIVYKSAGLQGRSVLETDDLKAKAELTALIGCVYGDL